MESQRERQQKALLSRLSQEVEQRTPALKAAEALIAEKPQEDLAPYFSHTQSLLELISYRLALSFAESEAGLSGRVAQAELATRRMVFRLLKLLEMAYGDHIATSIADSASNQKDFPISFAEQSLILRTVGLFLSEGTAIYDSNSETNALAAELWGRLATLFYNSFPMSRLSVLFDLSSPDYDLYSHHYDLVIKSLNLAAQRWRLIYEVKGGKDSTLLNAAIEYLEVMKNMQNYARREDQAVNTAKTIEVWKRLSSSKKS